MCSCPNYNNNSATVVATHHKTATSSLHLYLLQTMRNVRRLLSLLLLVLARNTNASLVRSRALASLPIKACDGSVINTMMGQYGGATGASQIDKAINTAWRDVANRISSPLSKQSFTEGGDLSALML